MYHYTSGGFEFNSYMRFLGQNREKTIFKLQDHAKGFEFGQERPVVCCMNGERSNVAVSNYFENITIDTGIGNPGAVGIIFFNNNSGAIRNVTVRSGDPDRVGAYGIWLRNEIHSACNVFDTQIDGFDYGVRISTFRTVSHFENITLNEQRLYGIMTDNNSVQFIGVKSHNNVPVLCMSCNSTLGHVVMVDGEFVSDGTDYAAIKKEVGGQLFLRNIHAIGFACVLEENWFERRIDGNYIEEFSSHPGFGLFDERAKSLGLEIPHVPDPERINDFSQWACVNDFGAVGDTIHDDTEAIQAAFSSGKPVIWFQPGHYLISAPIEIPETVEYVHFMYSEIRGTNDVRARSGDAAFRICGESEKLLLVDKLCAWVNSKGAWTMFRQDNRRSVFFRDCHAQCCAFYRNTVPGAELFFENCACHMNDNHLYGHIPGFSFHGQKAWCHSINPERSKIEVENVGGQVWWSGFKVEQEGSIVATSEGGVTEVLGGVAVVGNNKDIPLILNDNSTVSAIFDTAGYHEYSTYPVAVKEIRGEEVREISDKDCPQRCSPWYFMPLYSGRRDG
jgi:hypothetical protein